MSINLDGSWLDLSDSLILLKKQQKKELHRLKLGANMIGRDYRGQQSL